MCSIVSPLLQTIVLLRVQVFVMDNLLKSIEAVKNQVTNKNVEVGVNLNSKVKLPYPVLLNSSSYPLNKSRSKFAAVGLHYYGAFAPVVLIYGPKNDWTLLSRSEWEALVENQGVISNYFCSGDFLPQPVIISNEKRICFQRVGPTKVIILQDKCGSEVYLGVESIAECWELLHLLEYKMEVLKSLEFEKFYSNIIRGVSTMPGEFKSNIENVLSTLNIKSDNVVCMLEMLKFALDIIQCDIEMEQYKQTVNQ